MAQTHLLAHSLLLIAVAALFSSPSYAQTRWTQFARVQGQPEAVPIEWIASADGQYAHSIKVPNPVPDDSGYRLDMNSSEYFDHLCKNEAGEFIFRSVAGVEGFYLMRPPLPPSDDDLMDRYKLEAPDIERLFQLYRATPGDRSTIFVIPNFRRYSYVEEKISPDRFVHASGFETGTTRPKPLREFRSRSSQFGLLWRGLKRPYDRENAIAGSEWLVLDLSTSEVLAVFRNYARTGRVRNAKDGIWWLNAIQCPGLRPVRSTGQLGQQWYDFVSQVLRPQTKVQIK